MKKILTIILGVLAVGFTGCLKDTSINTNGLNTMPNLVEIPYSGLEYFSSATVLTAGATAPIVIPVTINLTSIPTKDVIVTTAISDAARTAYNAANPTSPQYVAMPDSCMSFASKTVTIKAGTQQGTVNITFYPAKIDPTKNYMAALAITDGGGVTISGNFAVNYFHTIGNPFAGLYTNLYNRWNNATMTGSATTVVTYPNILGAPDDPNTFELQAGYGTQGLGATFRYVVTFTGTSKANATNFAVSLNAGDVANIVASGFAIGTPPSIVLADGPNAHFKFTWVVINSAGAPRSFTDEFTHQ